MSRPPRTPLPAQPPPPPATPSQPSRRTTELPPLTPGYIARRPGFPVHPLVLLAILLVVFGLLIVGGLYVVTAQPVTLVIEGVRRDVRTRQATVGGLLDELNQFIETQDRLTPGRDTPITPGMLISIDKAQSVIIDVDGQRMRVLTHNTAPAAVLTEFGVVVRDGDVLYVDGVRAERGAPPLAFSNLRVERAVDVTIRNAGTTVRVRTAGRTVADVLSEAGITLYVADVVTPPLDSLVADAMTISIQQAMPIRVQVDGRLLETRTAAENVGAALAGAGIALVGLDYAIPSEDMPVLPEMTIRVVRVTETDEVERTEIAFRQVVQTDASIAPDTQRVIQPGQSGIRERRVRIRLEDGVEVSRSAPREAIVRDPQDEIIAVGARPSLLSTPSPVGTASAEPAARS